MVDWTLITVTYNSELALRRFFQGNPPLANVEWIVVDNASADSSVEVAREYGARVIALQENLGFAAANNVGLRASQGQYVGFVNPDVGVNFCDLARLRDHLESNGDRLLAPQLVNTDGSLQPNGRGVPTLLRKLGNRIGRGSSDGYQLYAVDSRDLYVSWVIGAAVFSHRRTFERLGGWDERFFVYYEDHDLGLRAWAAGIPVVVTGGVRWMHGWARETLGFKLRPWLLEGHGAVMFFSRYPGLLLSARLLGRRHAGMRAFVGRKVWSVPSGS
jgi:GT2 family glycosyltransferase